MESKVIHKWREPPEKGKKKRKKVKSHRTLVVSSVFFILVEKKFNLVNFFLKMKRKHENFAFFSENFAHF